MGNPMINKNNFKHQLHGHQLHITILQASQGKPSILLFLSSLLLLFMK
ncbi:mCG1035374 [Mus musculus]|nr:mCG1035374 [Mus musculus]